MPGRCSKCGKILSIETSGASQASGICPACKSRLEHQVTALDGLEALTDEWLEGDQAVVRSRRPYGEPRFR